MNKTILSFLILAICILPIHGDEDLENANSWLEDGIQSRWQAYKTEFQKEYQNLALEMAAFRNWLNNLKKIELLGETQWIAGETSLSDLSDIDFQTNYLSHVTPPEDNDFLGITVTDASKLPDAPATKDWVALGKVTPVKAQGGCGSCWAFAIIGAVESLNLIVNGGSPQLYSEQKLVDCYKGNGCAGGWAPRAVNWVQTNGVTLSAYYPYYAKVLGTEKCLTLPRAPFNTYGGGTILGDADLQKALAIQPVIVLVDASKWGSYKGGIFGTSEADCSSRILNHNVLAVGYTQEYWVIKNSWGTQWGEHGYIKISRNRENACGISAYARYPLRAPRPVSS